MFGGNITLYTELCEAGRGGPGRGGVHMTWMGTAMTQEMGAKPIWRCAYYDAEREKEIAAGIHRSAGLWRPR